jgi:anti-anti-sigma factor
MSAKSLPEATPAAPVLVGPSDVEIEHDPSWGSHPASITDRRRIGDGPQASRPVRALFERGPAGRWMPSAADSPTPDPAFALAIARAMGVVVVTAHGPLDAANGAVLKSVLADLIEGQGNMNVIVDLHDVAVVDPSSLGVLVASAASAASRGGGLTLSDPCEAVAADLETSGLSPAFTVTHRRRLRSLSPPSHRPDDDELRRISMSQHPAGAGDPGRSLPTPRIDSAFTM